MAHNSIFLSLFIALALGLLVGLQRESVSSKVAGIRTFPLVTVFGTICGLLGQEAGAVVIAMGLLATASLVLIGKYSEFKVEKADPGLTTEIALLLMYGVGAYLVYGNREVAIAIGGGTAVLLHFKGELHQWVARLSEKDLRAIMQFALISMVVLPILPNRTYGPYAVLNPRNIWLMVVLIVGIGLSGYIVYKFIGSRAGLLLGGVIGGLISSTATTVSFARRTKASPGTTLPATIILLIASAIVFIRVMIEIATVSIHFLWAALVPLSLMLGTLALLILGLWFRDRDQIETISDPENPSELKPALLFGLLYALILLAAAFVRDRFGLQGLYVVAGISGLTDVDAITLSTSQLVNLDRIAPEDGRRVIVLAIMANLVFKTGTVAFIGDRGLFYRVGACFAIVLVVGAVFLFFG